MADLFSKSNPIPANGDALVSTTFRDLNTRNFAAKKLEASFLGRRRLTAQSRSTSPVGCVVVVVVGRQDGDESSQKIAKQFFIFVLAQGRRMNINITGGDAN